MLLVKPWTRLLQLTCNVGAAQGPTPPEPCSWSTLCPLYLSHWVQAAALRLHVCCIDLYRCNRLPMSCGHGRGRSSLLLSGHAISGQLGHRSSSMKGRTQHQAVTSSGVYRRAGTRGLGSGYRELLAATQLSSKASCLASGDACHASQCIYQLSTSRTVLCTDNMTTGHTAGCHPVPHAAKQPKSRLVKHTMLFMTPTALCAEGSTCAASQHIVNETAWRNGTSAGLGNVPASCTVAGTHC
jgi:hypothetical protein